MMTGYCSGCGNQLCCCKNYDATKGTYDTDTGEQRMTDQQKLIGLKALADAGAFEWPRLIYFNESEMLWYYAWCEKRQGPLHDTDALTLVEKAAEDALVTGGTYLEINLSSGGRTYTLWCDERGLVIKEATLPDAIRAEMGRKSNA